MSRLDDLKRYFLREASGLKGYEEMTKQELGDGYCDAEEAHDEILKSQYYSAIIIRYWFKIYQWKEDSASLNLQDDDFVEWLEDALYWTFHYKSWRDPAKAVYGDPNGFDKCVNMCCFSRRGEEYQKLNKLKRKANTHVYSLDASVDDCGDCALETSGNVTEPNYFSGAKKVISLFLDQNKMLEALVLDGIAYGDSMKEIKTTQTVTRYDEETDEEYEETVTTTSSEFDKRKLIKHLTSIDDKFMVDYFNIEYNVSPKQSKAALKQLKELTNDKLYKVVAKTLIEVNTPEMLQLLGYSK